MPKPPPPVLPVDPPPPFTALFTVTLSGLEVLLTPVSVMATAVMVWDPAEELLVFQEI